MVQRDVEEILQKVYGMWYTTTTLPSDVYITYHYKRIVPTAQTSSGEFYDILHELSSDVGIWGAEEDENVSEGDGDI